MASKASPPPPRQLPFSPYGDDFDFAGLGNYSDYKPGDYKPGDYKPAPYTPYTPPPYNFFHRFFAGSIYDWDGKLRWSLVAERAVTIIAAFIILSAMFNCLNYHKEDIKAWWRRRHLAAKYKRVKKVDSAEQELESSASGGELSGGEDDMGLLEVVTATFTPDRSVPVTIDLGDGKAPKTCEAYVADLEKVSQLPFLLADACRRSGDPALGAFSLVDLYLKDRVRLEYAKGTTGEMKPVGKFGLTTPDMLLAARSFKATVLPQTTH